MSAHRVCARNQNLLTLGVGKFKLKAAHYTFEPKELNSVAAKTGPFSRDGFAQGSIYKNLGCRTDACWIPERPFECNNHRGHHCWLDPLVNMLKVALQPYAASKQHDPSNTRMCIFVPIMRKATWWKSFKSVKKSQGVFKRSRVVAVKNGSRSED